RVGPQAYRYGNAIRRMTERNVIIRYRKPDGSMGARRFLAYWTHHGPIVRSAGGRWIAFAMMDKPVEALQQSFLRTKTTDLKSFIAIADRFKANSSNNTLFADDKGEIAYLHPQFVPVRNDRFDYNRVDDGSDPRTDWRGLHPLATTPNVRNPSSGFVQNTNNWPWNAGGVGSIPAARFPRYMDTAGETPRGLHALRVLDGRHDFTLEGLRAAAYDPYLTAFARLTPGLLKAYDAAPDPALAGQIAALRGWDYRWSAESVPTSLAVFWGEEMVKRASGGQFLAGMATYDRIDAAPAALKVAALAAASERLRRDFGRWQVPWGEINRFQRLTADIVHPFSDAGPSIPVPFASARWGSLASFGAAPRNGSKRWYGTSGNSFVAVVEFGARVRARAVTAGGESGHPGAPHFDDQAERYASGNLRDVYFWPDQLKGHVERSYRPGE
ncbi:MAG TPA: penicillin acylase family protein, partial [Allosphingosinicella sp.]|nr:penicillin acylase family protein [Allosphingosinicella sp.]